MVEPFKNLGVTKILCADARGFIFGGPVALELNAGMSIARKPNKLPTMDIPDKNWNGLLNWSAKDGFTLKDYICHEALKGEVAR